MLSPARLSDVRSEGPHDDLDDQPAEGLAYADRPNPPPGIKRPARKDERVLEKVLDRYIGPLTIMGAIAIGLLAALADLAGSLVHGTSLLLTVMIVYKLYEEIAKQHMYDMHPMMRKFMDI